MPEYRISDLSAFEINEADWNKSSGGNTCKAKRIRDGAPVFIKRYTGFKEPIHDASTSDAVYAKRMEKFEHMVQVRSKVNRLMREVSGRGGNIIIPYDEFVCDHMYTEVSDFIPGLMRPEEILGLSDKDKLMFIMTAVNALSAVHERHVIHVDIKPPNVIAVRNSRGMAVGKIIDFDSSLLSDQPIPPEITSDQIYQSPEQAWYNDSEGDPDAAKLVSEKTDIFSMGMTLHYYLTGGKLPGYTGVSEPGTKERIEKKEGNGQPVFCWEVLLGDGALVMDPSLKKPIAYIIAKMTLCNPEKRPGCKEVFTFLQSVKSGTAFHFERPKGTDAITWNEEKLLDDGYTEIQSSRLAGAYELAKFGGVVTRMTVADLKRNGYAVEGTGTSTGSSGTSTGSSGTGTVRPGPWDDPDPKDGIKCWDEERIKSRGYTGIRALGGGKYALIRDGRAMGEYEARRLILLKYAIAGRITRPEEDVFEKPDSADGIAGWNEEKMRSRGYTGVHSIGGGKYILISHGRNQGEYDKDRLLRLGYGIK